MKIYSLFLPQFYETKENDEWWGKGFTEWTNVRNAKPLFRGHKQPKQPLNNNYYCMLDKSTVEWQTSLMKQYGIDGLIYYHYYFNGRMLLEKPAENLLKWKDIDQPFFICWANHTWYRSWEGSKTVLVQQTYGNRSDWRKHFEYLVQFFKDYRYIKENNKPLFMIYDTATDPEIIDEMFACFDTWCKDAGFDGMKCIKECFTFPSEAEVEKDREKYLLYLSNPLCGRIAYQDRSLISHYWNSGLEKIFSKYGLPKPYCIDGDKVYEWMTAETSKYKPSDVVPGLFFEWDNTPRHKKRGYVITHVSKDTFMKYMDSIKESDIAIVNAWNEWAEGMILEPTQEDRYQNLEWIKEWKEKHK